jgi:hypothetical protein
VSEGDHSMSTVLMRVPLTEGSDEFIEVEVDPRCLGDAVELVTSGYGEVARAPFSLAGSMGNLVPALSTILTSLRRAEHTPDEIGMVLGLSLGGETGLVFAKGTTQATFTVTMTWRKPQAAIGSVPGGPAVPAQLTVG